MKKIDSIDIIELFDSYITLRKLEDKTEYYGNVEFLFDCLEIPVQINKLFAHIFENYCKDKDV